MRAASRRLCDNNCCCCCFCPALGVTNYSLGSYPLSGGRNLHQIYGERLVVILVTITTTTAAAGSHSLRPKRVLSFPKGAAPISGGGAIGGAGSKIGGGDSGRSGKDANALCQNESTTLSYSGCGGGCASVSQSGSPGQDLLHHQPNVNSSSSSTMTSRTPDRNGASASRSARERNRKSASSVASATKVHVCLYQTQGVKSHGPAARREAVLLRNPRYAGQISQIKIRC